MNDRLISQIHDANQVQRNQEQQGVVNIVPIRRRENVEEVRDGGNNDINIE